MTQGEKVREILKKIYSKVRVFNNTFIRSSGPRIDSKRKEKTDPTIEKIYKLSNDILNRRWEDEVIVWDDGGNCFLARSSSEYDNTYPFLENPRDIFLQAVRQNVNEIDQDRLSHLCGILDGYMLEDGTGFFVDAGKIEPVGTVGVLLVSNLSKKSKKILKSEGYQKGKYWHSLWFDLWEPQ
jgi:hypothetical protein